MGQAVFPAVILVDNAGGAVLQPARAFKGDAVSQTRALAGMMVKPEFAALHIRNVGKDIVVRDLDKAVLQILRVDKFP
jgi:hypothetical protein